MGGYSQISSSNQRDRTTNRCIKRSKSVAHNRDLRSIRLRAIRANACLPSSLTRRAGPCRPTSNISIRGLCWSRASSPQLWPSRGRRISIKHFIKHFMRAAHGAIQACYNSYNTYVVRETRCGKLDPSSSACACRQTAEAVLSAWPIAMDGRPVMRVPDWWRRVSGGRNSRSSIFANPPQADKPTSKGARSRCGR